MKAYLQFPSKILFEHKAFTDLRYHKQFHGTLRGREEKQWLPQRQDANMRSCIAICEIWDTVQYQWYHLEKKSPNILDFFFFSKHKISTCKRSYWGKKLNKFWVQQWNGMYVKLMLENFWDSELHLLFFDHHLTIWQKWKCKQKILKMKIDILFIMRRQSSRNFLAAKCATEWLIVQS